MATSREREGAERFRSIAERELARLYALARRLVGDEAEDVLQETLLRAFRAFSDLDDEAAAGAWLTTILVNCCRDHWRKLGRRVEEVELEQADDFSLFRKIADEDPFPYSDSVHLDFLQQFGTEDVRAILASLPELYRVPLVLVHMAGYHVKEVAHMLDVPLGTMLARLHRGRKLFERELWTYAERHGLLKEGANA
ncbi:MAG TPA: sigma-70 family RNA polymerase sigma factor [Gaiellaceae bacterium]|nr:sigma-70 family RNA polymerase sigma factor [Gaiellaceae bacterium]